jgi:hypothetical protein
MSETFWTGPAGIGYPDARTIHRLREVLCGEPDLAPAPAWTLSDDEVCALVDALHDIASSASYLHRWAELDEGEAAAVETIRAAVGDLLDAFGAEAA